MVTRDDEVAASVRRRRRGPTIGRGPRRLAVGVAVLITGAGGVGLARAEPQHPLRWSVGLGVAGGAVGDGQDGGVAVAASVGSRLTGPVTVEAVADLAVPRLHMFVGAGVRVAPVPRLHLALAFGVDQVWTPGQIGADAHARLLPAFRVALGVDVHAGRRLRIGVEVGGFSAPLYDVGDEPEFPDERISVALRLYVRR